jgi:hypothetical protein
MSGRDDSDLYKFAESVFASVSLAANPVIERKLAERGVTLEALSPAEQADLLTASFAETMAGAAGDAALVQLKRIFDAISDPRFMDAVRRLRGAPYGAAFDPAQGWDAAIVLAGAGLAVTPLDRRTGQPIGPRATGIDEADKVFSAAKTAWVGFAPAEAAFYTLVTDDLRTLFGALQHDGNFAGLKTTIEGAGGFPYRPETPSFRHGMLLVARQPEDRIASLTVETPDRNMGSIVMAAGWMDGGKVKGAPDGGLVPAPAQLARTIARQPTVLEWIAAPAGGLVATAA